MNGKSILLWLLVVASLHSDAQTARVYTNKDVKEYFLYIDKTMGSADEERAGNFATMFIASPDTVLMQLNRQSHGVQNEYLSLIAWGILNVLNSDSAKTITAGNYQAIFYKMMPEASRLYTIYKWQMDTLLEKMKEELE